jgi:hypothetical protein
MNKTGWKQKTGITDWTFGTWNVQTMLQPGNKTQRKTKNEMAG